MEYLPPARLLVLDGPEAGGLGSRKEKGLFYSSPLVIWLGVCCFGRMRAATMIRLALLVSHVLHVGGFCLPWMSTWYFSCRHTFEDTLRSELYRSGAKEGATKLVAPGLLRVDRLPEHSLHGAWDLTYALQALPDARAVGSEGASIAELAREAIMAVGLEDGGSSVEMLRSAPKGALAIHALVTDAALCAHARRLAHRF